MAQSPQGKGVASKLENLPKEELLKFIKKQALNSKELKKKIEDLNEELKKEQEDVTRLENEKKEWLSRGVSAEFEKKDKLLKKEKELLLAAELGKEMLAENDELHTEIDELKQEHDQNIQSYEDEIEVLIQEKSILEDALRVVQEDYRLAIKEAHECREELKDAMKNTPSNTQSLINENDELKLKIKDLEHQLTSASSNAKFQKLKEKYDEILKENKLTKESKLTLEEECKKKSERMVNLDKDMKNLKKESAELQKKLKSSQVEIDELLKSNETLSAALQVADENTKMLEERTQKLKAEKDSQAKSIKTLKTKIERAGQMEEELKKQLSNIVNERDELLRKQQQKRQQLQKKNKSGTTSHDKMIAEKDENIKELHNQICLIEKENTDLQNGLSSLSDKNGQLTEQYQNIFIECEKLNKNISDQKEQMKILKCEKDAYSDEVKILKDKLKQQAESTTTATSITTSEKKTTKGKKGGKKQNGGSKQEKKSDIVEKSVYEELKFSYEALEKEVDMYRTRSPETKGTILRLENRVDELLNQLQTLNEEKLNQESELEELFKSFDDLRNKYDFECKERESIEKELHSLEEKIKLKEEGKEQTAVELEEQISSLEITIKELTSEKDYLRQEVQVKDDCIKKLSNDLEESNLKQLETNKQNNDEIDRIVNEFHQLSQQMDSTKLELDDTFKEKEDAFLQIDVLKKEIDSLNENISQIAQELNHSKIEVHEKTEEITILNEKLKEKIESEVSQEENKTETSQYKDFVNVDIQTTHVSTNHSDSQTYPIENTEAEIQTEQENVGDNDGDNIEQYKSMLETIETEKNNEIDILRNKIKNLNENLVSFDEEVQHLTSENKSLKEKIQEALLTENSLNGKVGELSAKLQGTETELLQYKDEFSLIQSILTEIGFSNIGDVQKAFEILNNESECIKKELIEKNSATEEQLQDLTKTLEETKTNLDLCQTDLSSKQTELVSLKEDYQTLEKTLNETKNEISELQSTIEEKDKAIEMLKNELKESRETEAAVKQRYEDEMLTMKNEISNLQQNYDQTVNLNNVGNADIEALKVELQDKTEQIEKILEENSTLKTENTLLGNQIEELKTEENTHLQSSVDNTELQLKVQELEDIKIDYLKSKELLNQRDDELKELHSSVEHLKHLYNDCRIDGTTNNENYHNEMHEKDETIATLKDERNTLTKTLEQCHIKIAEFADMCNSLKDEIDEKGEQLEGLTNEKHSLKESLEELTENIATKEEQLQLQQTKIEKLETEVQTNVEKSNELEHQIQIYEEQIKTYANDILTREAEFKNVLKSKDEEIELINIKLEDVMKTKTDTDSESQVQINELQNNLMSKNEEYGSLERQMKELETSLSDYKIKSADYELSLSLKDKEINELKDYSIISLNESKADFENRILELEDKCLLLQDENKMLNDDLSSAEDQCKDLSSVIDEHERNKSVYSNLEDELQSALNKVDELDCALKEEQGKYKQLEFALTEKSEKAAKFKNMAIKAKKELDSKRAEFMETKSNLETHLKLSFDEMKLAKAELTRQKTECAKHEEEFVEMQNEIKMLEEKLEHHANKSTDSEDLQRKLDEAMLSRCSYEEQVESLQNTNREKDDQIKVVNMKYEEINDQLNELNEEVRMKNEQIDEKEKEITELKEEHEKLKETLHHAEKGSQQLSLMALEIDDYLKTTDSLNEKLKNKDGEVVNLKQEIDEYKATLKKLDEQTTSLSSEKTEMDNMNRKLKQMIMKLKKEMAELKKSMEEGKTKDHESQKTIEQLLKSNDESKIQVSNLSGEKANLKEQLKRANDMHEKAYQSLEVKYARANNDVIAKETMYQQLQEEYENYKIRAHSVLKQQKTMKNENLKEQEEKERNRYEEVIEDLKLRLQEANQQLNIISGEHGDLEIDHERLQTKYAEMMQQLANKEMQWKERFVQMKGDLGTKVSELQEKLSLSEKSLAHEKMNYDEILKTSKTKEEELREEMKKMNHELRKYEKLLREETKTLNKQHSNDGKTTSNDLTLVLNKSVSERQEGEGMDSRELELIDNLSQKSSVPQTPNTPSEAFLLETLLSPVDKDVPKSPSELRDEVAHLKSSIAMLNKKNDHVTSLLRESEENTCMLTDQAKVLKEEIRRLERNTEREEALSNLEYLKNVIIKFLQVGSVEKEQLIPVICTMLKLSTDEKDFITEFAKGENNESSADASWSSYVYSWTSLT